jgi:hypothetical protein
MEELVALRKAELARKDREQVLETRRNEAKIAEPTGIDGKDARAVNTFVFMCNNLFSARPYQYDTDVKKIRFAIGLFQGDLASNAEALQDDEGSYPTWKEGGVEKWVVFTRWLKSVYGEKDVKGRAKRELDSLEQVGPASALIT